MARVAHGGTFRTLQADSHERRGPGLVELLIVVTVVLVASALGMRAYAACHTNALERAVELAARHAALAEEAYFGDAQRYASGDCTGLPGFVRSPGVVCTAVADEDGFTVHASHPGTGHVCECMSSPGSARANLRCV
jgi:Tfp pilus assembly protein PilE